MLDMPIGPIDLNSYDRCPLVLLKQLKLRLQTLNQVPPEDDLRDGSAYDNHRLGTLSSSWKLEEHISTEAPQKAIALL
ncbi:hypothetical protein L1987_33495 [Smallanthus sonchifolius]|uniref:Uncharacterized protein n=1 Tax=Smallanthus sonchifolius TaxID=185202 RepID=A0ACB9HQZ9_9ASTR|nr:hypothetical protein L1987_33495 [Smallanthus sonchifolius]